MRFIMFMVLVSECNFPTIYAFKQHKDIKLKNKE